jgi:sec-independent protein translocase protein TatB
MRPRLRRRAIRKQVRPTEVVVFDVGFQEIVLVMLVALVVFGPEQLPGFVRDATLWVRKLKGLVSDARHEIDKEFQLYELQKEFADRKRRFEEESRSILSKSDMLKLDGSGHQSHQVGKNEDVSHPHNDA